MNSEFWSKSGLLLFILGTVGWFTDFSVLELRWVYLPILAIGCLLYLAPKEYYGKKKGEDNGEKTIL